MLSVGMKTVRIFSDRIRNRIRLEGLRSVRIRVWISNIWYRIRILKLHIYDVDIQSYPIRHSWHYPYSNPNPNRNTKTNVISVISVRIRSVFIPSADAWWNAVGRPAGRRVASALVPTAKGLFGNASSISGTMLGCDNYWFRIKFNYLYNS